MARTCRLVRGGRTADAQWRREGDALVVTPSGGPTLVVPLERVRGIGGDGHTITLALAEGDVSLERLGGDGPTLLGELRRDWPPLRAAALRLAAGGTRAGEVFSGTVAAPGARGAFRGFLAEGRLLLAVEGGDLGVLFPADWSSVAADDQSAVRCSGWDGAETVFARLGAKTRAFAGALAGERDALAVGAHAILSRHLPSLDAGARTALAEQWLPGRLLSVESLERVAHGFSGALDASWLASMPRAKEGRALMAGVAPAACHLAYGVPPGWHAGEDDAEIRVWLLVRGAAAWTLELLSHGDYATYLFCGEEEVPGLVEGLVRLPEFSREALYLPLEELVGDRSRFVTAVTDLPLLRDLRGRFSGRRVHAAGKSVDQ